MKAGFEIRLATVWLVLAALTLASYLLASDIQGAWIPNTMITCSVILVSLFKVRLILMEFMEVRHAPVLLCRLTDAWLLITALCLLGIYFVGITPKP